MDQEKIGRFIAECRKERGFTQAQLAERVSVSNRAVSKWETGKSLPDASIMIELSDTLGITVNELLSGERLNGDEYRSRAEANVAELHKQTERYVRRIAVNNVFLIAVAILCAFEAPFATIFVVLIMAYRNYFLFKNMKAVRQMIEDEGIE